MTGSEKRRPRIAITVNPGVAAEYYGTYARAVEDAGAEAVLVQPGDEVNIEGFDGLLLPGGHRARGMREYLESEILQKLVGDFLLPTCRSQASVTASC